MPFFSLPESGFLSVASDDLKRMLAAQAVPVELAAGDVLFEQGTPGDSLYAILQGQMEFSILSANGRKLALDLMGPGAVFGEITLFDPGPHTATVTALTPARLLRVRHADVLDKIHHPPDLADDMIRLAGQRMRWMGRQLNEQVFLPLATRLARRLLHLGEVTGGAQSGAVGMSQAELAEFVGATREAVSKTLSNWREAGIIQTGRGGVTIHDPCALRALADLDAF
ncbi:Crp/Fnr family transcriptional regulator [Antarcticimicrobium sediminis]|uniref:Crp/Fnr family transcriptional regulator n=1 Tax=Antarcticimicrobium sediminis TaxID=2546227 RepID=A0A4R5EYN9_9RHOB|nr:Crp/Fnr family transcriptional regulator [Antarcticimicrobium sediminis]TDE40151.1 Crp/Fnr family transcriptional regulator [Antarcticimicrobium sediminis]